MGFFLDFGNSKMGCEFEDFPPAGTLKPGIVKIDLSILDGLSGNATVIGNFRGSYGSEAPSSSRKDVSRAK